MVGSLPSCQTTSLSNTCWERPEVYLTHGLPKVIVSDNGTAFTSEELAAFVRHNSIQHLTSAPYHLVLNGLAKRAVQTLKNALKEDTDGVSIETKIAWFLFRYRFTPQSTTGAVPAKLLIGQRPRSRLDLLYPDVTDHVRQRQGAQKADHDQRCCQRELVERQTVWVKNYTAGCRWLLGTISKVVGQQRFHIMLEDGRVVDRHIDHVRSRVTRTRVDPPTKPVIIDPEITSNTGGTDSNSPLAADSPAGHRDPPIPTLRHFVKEPTTSGPICAQLKSCIVESKGGGIVVSVSKWNWNYCVCIMSLNYMCVTFYIMLCVYKCAYSCQ